MRRIEDILNLLKKVIDKNNTYFIDIFNLYIYFIRLLRDNPSRQRTHSLLHFLEMLCSDIHKNICCCQLTSRLFFKTLCITTEPKCRLKPTKIIPNRFTLLRLIDNTIIKLIPIVKSCLC
jgi:hypothetical protein